MMIKTIVILRKTATMSSKIRGNWNQLMLKKKKKVKKNKYAHT